jgi:hypothetical protein
LQRTVSVTGGHTGAVLNEHDQPVADFSHDQAVRGVAQIQRCSRHVAAGNTLRGRQRYCNSSTKTVPGVAVGFTVYLTLVEIEPPDPRDNLNSDSTRRKFPSSASRLIKGLSEITYVTAQVIFPMASS